MDRGGVSPTEHEERRPGTYTERLSRLVTSPSRIGIRFFSSASDAPRARRPTDAMLLLLALATITIASFAAPGTGSLATATQDFLEAVPGLFGWFWELCHALLLVWALVLLGASIVGRGRFRLLRDQILAAALAVGGGALLISGSASLADALTTSGPPPIYPGVRLAAAIAIVMTTAPHLGRPLRRFGRWLVTLGTVAEVALLTTVPLGAITGLALGLGAGALVHLVLGSPGGRPTPEQVVRSLADLGIPVREVHEAELAPRGVALMEATSEDGRPLLVKVYGRDAWDGQLFNVVWSYLWYRNETPNLTLSRLQQVEHEAFLNLLAERAGVPVQPAVAAGMADEDALLVVEIRARWLRSIDDDQVTEELAHDLWRSLLRMHEAGIAHGAIDDDHLAVLPDGSGAIGGFGRATAAPTPAQIRSDRAQLLVATARRLGDTRAIAAAKAEMGAEALAEVLPFIQRAAMTPPTRRALKEADVKLDALREAAAAAAGTEAPKLEPIRRVTWSSVILIVVLVAAAWAVIVALSNVGVESIVSELKSADPAWLWAALLVSPSVQVAEAFSTLGACPVPLTLGPVIGLQFAIRFIALAVPSSAARIALNVRFFQRAGLAASPAIAVGMVDSVAGFLVQVVLLVLIWVTGLATLTTSLNGAQLDINGKLVAGVAILVVLAVAALFLIPRIRNLILPRLAEAAEALKVLKSPAKDLELFAGNLAAQVFLAMVLGACLRAFGQHATLAELILVNTLASLLSGVLPVPGGIGVMEAAISGGLIAVGIPESAALSTAIMFRLVTFYLPPIWGAVAMRNLRRRGYI